MNYLELIIGSVLEDVPVDGVAVLKLLQPVEDLSLQLLVLHIRNFDLVDDLQGFGRLVQAIEAVSLFKDLKQTSNSILSQKYDTVILFDQPEIELKISQGNS